MVLKGICNLCLLILMTLSSCDCLEKLRLCCLSEEALAKCEAFSAAASLLQQKSDLTFGSDYREIDCVQMSSKMLCMMAIDANERSGPNAMMVEAGDTFEAGRYHSLIPILRELYVYDRDYTEALAVIRVDSELHKRASESRLRTIDLRSSKVCFSEVGSLAGWHLPLYRLMHLEQGMRIVDCNNHVKSAMDFFGEGCATNVLRDRFNPLGDNSQQFCELCGSLTPGIRCTTRDPFAGFRGALRCIEKGHSDIAFLNDLVLEDKDNKDLRLLCPRRSQVDDDYFTDNEEALMDDLDFSIETLEKVEECSWGRVPSQSLVVSSAMVMDERKAIQRMLVKAAQLFGQTESYNDASYDNDESNDNDEATNYGEQRTDYYDDLGPEQQGFGNSNNFGSNYGNSNNLGNNLGSNYGTSDNTAEDSSSLSLPSGNGSLFKMFESSPKYGLVRDVLFSDSARGFAAIQPDRMSYKSFLGTLYGSSSSTSSGFRPLSPLSAIEGASECGVSRMALCVTSDAEMIKCSKMRTALKAQLLQPQMQCVRRREHLECMAAIARGDADLVMLDAGDVYRAGHNFGLVPIMAEVYNLDGPFAYAVAVAKQRDNASELIYLKNRNTCHTGVGHGAGWVVPMAWLITNERVRDYGCDSLRAAAQYFSKSCAPGANDQIMADLMNNGRNLWETDHLCDLCHGSAEHYCDRNHHEDYFGHSGAFRCLVEGGGHVAFVKHTAVTENCDGKRREWWARNQLTTDYELLCRDGTRAPATEYKRCYLGTVKANAAVTNPKFGKRRIEAFINLLQYAQQFYGQKTADEFSFAMFYSQEPHADLIFQDATQQLIVLDEDQRHFRAYLDNDFLQAYEKVMCNSEAIRLNNINSVLLLSVSLKMVFTWAFGTWP